MIFTDMKAMAKSSCRTSRAVVCEHGDVIIKVS